jgi:hypothetical protein
VKIYQDIAGKLPLSFAERVAVHYESAILSVFLLSQPLEE